VGNTVRTTEGRFDYKAGQMGFPVLTRIEFDTGNSGEGKMQIKVIREFQLMERDGIPESEFTLSAFGLPEPVELQGPRSQTRWYLWAGVAGILCLALGAGLRWRAQRIAA
jgi:hypothetical protein